MPRPVVCDFRQDVRFAVVSRSSPPRTTVRDATTTTRSEDRRLCAVRTRARTMAGKRFRRSNGYTPIAYNTPDNTYCDLCINSSQFYCAAAVHAKAQMRSSVTCVCVPRGPQKLVLECREWLTNSFIYVVRKGIPVLSMSIGVYVGHIELEYLLDSCVLRDTFISEYWYLNLR